jgi:mannose/fructose/N-acetylgalactosamine-specific phosphotransferase system component IIC
MNLFVLLSLVAGLLAVDDRAGWQGLLAQPVFAAFLVGLITGEVWVAIPVGLALELIWLSILPMRGSRRPDQVAGAITGAGSASLVMHYTADPRVALVSSVGIVLGLVAGEIGGYISNGLFKAQNWFLSRVEFTVRSDRRGMVYRLFWLHSGSIAYIFIVEAIVAFLFLGAGFGVAEALTGHAAGSFAKGAATWGALVPAFGAAALIQFYWRRYLKRVMILSAALVVLLLWLQ